MLRGPDFQSKKDRRLYPGISRADEVNEETSPDWELPSKKTVVGVLLRNISHFLRASAPQVNSASGSRQAPSRGCEEDLA